LPWEAIALGLRKRCGDRLRHRCRVDRNRGRNAYVHDDSIYERNTARIDQLDAHVQQLEITVKRLAGRVAGETPMPDVPKATPTALTTEQRSPR